MHYPSFIPAHRPRFSLLFHAMKYPAGRLARRCLSASV
jgi:hypothetical protein